MSDPERETRRVDDALAMIGEVHGKHLAWLRGDPTKPKRETASLDPAMLAHAKASLQRKAQPDIGGLQRKAQPDTAGLQRKIERAAPPPGATLRARANANAFPWEATIAWLLAAGAVGLTALIATL